MSLFRRQNTDQNNLPGSEELEQYRAEGSGEPLADAPSATDKNGPYPAVVSAVILVAIIALVALLIHSGQNTSRHKATATNKGNHQAATTGGGSKQPAKTAPSASSGNATPGAAGTGGSTLTNTGPGDVILIFTAAAIAGTGLHYLIVLRRV